MWLASCRLCSPNSCLLKRKWPNVCVCVSFPLVTSSLAHPLQIVITNSFLFVRPPRQFCQASGGSWPCRLLFIRAGGWRIHLKEETVVQTEQWWCVSLPAFKILLPFALHHCLFAASPEQKCTGLSQPTECDPFMSQPWIVQRQWIVLISKYKETKFRITEQLFLLSGIFWKSGKLKMRAQLALKIRKAQCVHVLSNCVVN